MTKALIFFVALLCGAAYAQTSFPSRVNIDTQLDASSATLRDAIVKHRDVYLASCKRSSGQACDMVNLDDVEITLLDIQTKYRRASRSISSTATKEKFDKIISTASDAMQSISDLKEAISD
jgi:hypothetical protein